MRLEDWSVVASPLSGYRDPEQWSPKLYGTVYGNPKFADGSLIFTSRIVTVDKKAGTATTKSGSVYVLGEVSAEYENIHPNARERFFNQGVSNVQN